MKQMQCLIQIHISDFDISLQKKIVSFHQNLLPENFKLEIKHFFPETRGGNSARGENYIFYPMVPAASFITVQDITLVMGI